MKLLARCTNFIDAEEFRRYVAHEGGVPRRAVLVTFDDGLRDLRDAALPTLRELHVPAVVFVVTGLLGAVNEWDARKGHRALPLLDGDDLRMLARHDISIGAHTRTHPALPDLTAEEAKAEIEGSLDDVESLSVGRPALFAYPYGAYDEQAKRVAAGAGVVAAFTTKPGLVRPGGDRYEIPRIEILRRDRAPRFVWKIATAGRLRA
jgi:peptidoglycan/xylan/chitin deacetylase (PgdA/CDA1 family)